MDAQQQVHDCHLVYLSNFFAGIAKHVVFSLDVLLPIMLEQETNPERSKM
jgi:hypothetical protein